MKTLLFSLVILFSLTLTGCEKVWIGDPGIITGMDSRRCPSPCCGGYFIEISGKVYQFEKSELPKGFTFRDNELPLRVELKWKSVPVDCTEARRISIQRISTRN
jgi:hypothetical protein